MDFLSKDGWIAKKKKKYRTGFIFKNYFQEDPIPSSEGEGQKYIAKFQQIFQNFTNRYWVSINELWGHLHINVYDYIANIAICAHVDIMLGKKYLFYIFLISFPFHYTLIKTFLY